MCLITLGTQAIRSNCFVRRALFLYYFGLLFSPRRKKSRFLIACCYLISFSFHLLYIVLYEVLAFGLFKVRFKWTFLEYGYWFQIGLLYFLVYIICPAIVGATMFCTYLDAVNLVNCAISFNNNNNDEKKICAKEGISGLMCEFSFCFLCFWFVLFHNVRFHLIIVFRFILKTRIESFQKKS